MFKCSVDTRFRGRSAVPGPPLPGAPLAPSRESTRAVPIFRSSAVILSTSHPPFILAIDDVFAIRSRCCLSAPWSPCRP